MTDEKPRSEWTQDEWDTYWAEWDRKRAEWRASYDALVAECDKAERSLDHHKRVWKFSLWVEYTAYHALGLALIAIGVSLHPWLAALAAVLYVTGFGWALAQAVWAAMTGER